MPIQGMTLEEVSEIIGQDLSRFPVPPKDPPAELACLLDLIWPTELLVLAPED